MKKVDIIRIRYLIYCALHRNGYDHAAFLKKHNVFHSMGDDCFFQPWNVCADSQYVRFGNNVVVASNVDFVCHDVTDIMLNKSDISGFEYKRYWGSIDIGDNVFIGSGVQILPDVKVGNNVIIAAGAVVNSDIPDNVIVGGVPAKIIGNVDNFRKKRQEYSQTELADLKRPERIKYLWKLRDKEGKDDNV